MYKSVNFLNSETLWQYFKFLGRSLKARKAREITLFKPVLVLIEGI